MRQQTNAALDGWQKWALITSIVVGLSAIVLYFNFSVFGWYDGLPYTAVVLFLCLLSFIITRHIKRSPVTTNFLRAVFVFEVLLCLVLGGNAAVSLSVQREMSVAGLAETQRSTDLGNIAKLKGPKAQYKAVSQITANALETRQKIFARYERFLFWILMLEIVVGLTATFVLLGLSVFDKDHNGVPDFLEEWEPEEVEEIEEVTGKIPRQRM